MGYGARLRGRRSVLCLHTKEKEPGWGTLCGRETDLLCSHCQSPRCVHHGFLVKGKFLCLAEARVKLGIPQAKEIKP
jgi:hypothetical protein